MVVAAFTVIFRVEREEIAEEGVSSSETRRSSKGVSPDAAVAGSLSLLLLALSWALICPSG
jgi:hypothetical protein